MAEWAVYRRSTLMSWLYSPDGYEFGAVSLGRLAHCHPHLRKVAHGVIRVADVSVISGLRTSEEQQALHADGKSKLDGVTKFSMHQGDPRLVPKNRVSWAMDLMPWLPGVDVWQRADLFYIQAGIVLAVAERMGVPLRWGGDWDRDGQTWDQSFDDLPHFELYGPEYR